MSVRRQPTGFFEVLRAPFAWRLVGSLGVWDYYENEVTGERKAMKAASTNGPQHSQWLDGGEWEQTRPPPPAPSTLPSAKPDDPVSTNDCECPKCGRLHRKLANDPPGVIAGAYRALVNNQTELRELREHLDRALAQWCVYANLFKEGRDLATEDSPEGRAYRKISAALKTTEGNQDAKAQSGLHPARRLGLDG